MRLKILASTVLAVVLGYTLFWHYMAGEVEERIELWVKDQQSRGISIHYKDLEISGFPYRMELTLTALNVAKAGGNTAPVLIKSPAVTLVAFPWKINHGVIIGKGGEIRIGGRNRPKMELTFAGVRSSVVVDLGRRVFEQASFVLSDLSWTSGKPAGSPRKSTAREVRLHILKPAAASSSGDMELPVQMKIYLEASDVVAQEIPVGIFGRKADKLKVDLQLHGKKFPPFTRDGLGQWRDTGGTLAVNNVEIMSGEMDLQLAGEASLDQELKPLGAFSSTIYGVDHIVNILAGHSAFQKEPGNMILEELRRMSKVEQAGARQGRQAIDLAISLQGGLLFLGPIPVYELDPVVE